MRSENKNFLLNVVYQGLTLVFPLVTVPYISRVLGVDNVGIYSYTYSIAYMFMLGGMLGINNYGTRSSARVRDDRAATSAEFASIYCLQVGLNLVAVCGYAIYVVVFGAAYRTIALVQLVHVLSICFDVNWFYFGLEQFKVTIARNLVVKVLSLLLIFICVRSARDLWVYALIMAGSTLVSQLYLFALLPRRIDPRRPPARAVLSHLRGVAALFVPVLAFAIYRVMDKTMIGALASVTELGLFENAEKIINIPVAVITALGVVMLPRMAHILADPGSDYRRTIRESMNLALMLGASMGVGLVVVADDAAVVLFGPAFAGSGLIIRLLALTVVASAWSNVVRTQYLIPRGRDGVYIASTIGAAGLNLGLNLLLIGRLGAVGACIGTIAAEYFIMVYQSLATRRDLEGRRYAAMLARHLLLAALMAVAAVAAGRLAASPAARLAASSGAYAAAFLLIHGRYLVRDFLGLRS